MFLYKYFTSWLVERFVFQTISDNNESFYEIPAYTEEKKCLIQKEVFPEFWYLPDWAKK
jgi:hypothetical protein